MKSIYACAALFVYSRSVRAIQPGAAPAQPAPLRDLSFGDINFLHTTDTHGWHAGHLLESSYSADWGDFISFSDHLRKQLEGAGKDLLLIDTGDRIEGNGLYDSSDPRGKYTFNIFTQLQLTYLTPGNHELYKNSSAEDDWFKLTTAYSGRYIVGNLQIHDPETGQLAVFGRQYDVMTTKNGVKILTLGFIFDFTRNDKNTVVTPVGISIKQPWFLAAMHAATDADLIMVIGHVALRQTEMQAVYQAIRASHPDKPIQFFGGHFHIRDYRVFDQKAHALAAGRFMETIGFQSISNLSSDEPTYFRRYIDNNLYSLQHHSNTTNPTFTTSEGNKTSNMIKNARSALSLDQTFGCAPHDYWMARAAFDANDSIYSLLTNEIFPDIVNPTRSDKSRMILTNTGAIRFDIFKGPFTRDSTFIVSPFTSDLSFIRDVPYGLAKKLLPVLNGGDPQTSLSLAIQTLHKKWKFHLNDLAPPEQQARRYAQDHSDHINNLLHRFWELLGPEHVQKGLQSQTERVIQPSMSSKQQLLPNNDAQSHPLHDLPLTPGYTTHDDMGSDGDDTIHAPIPFYEIPNVIQAIFPSPSSAIHPPNTPEPTINNTTADDEPIDLIFNQFLTPYIIQLLNHFSAQTTKCSGTSDPSPKTAHDMTHETDQHHHCTYSHANSPLDVLSQISTQEDIDDFIQNPCFIQGLCEDYIPPSRRGTVEKRTQETGAMVKEQHRKYSEEDDVRNYVPGETFTTVLAKWVAQNWAENCDGPGIEVDSNAEDTEHFEL